jgi:hypothetical protein
LVTSFLQKHVTEGKIEGEIELTGIGGRRPKQLLDDLNPLNAELKPICYLLALLGAHHFLHVSRIRVKDKGEYLKLKVEANIRALWRIRFERSCRPVVRQTAV